jgi:hypothetical protein
VEGGGKWWMEVVVGWREGCAAEEKEGELQCQVQQRARPATTDAGSRASCQRCNGPRHSSCGRANHTMYRVGLNQKHDLSSASLWSHVV